MMHVPADGETFILVQFKTKNIKKVNRTLTMMLIANGIISFHLGGANVMKECNDPTTVIGELWRYFPHCAINSEGMCRQSSLISVVMMAMGCKVVAMMQICDNIDHTLSINVAQ